MLFVYEKVGVYEKFQFLYKNSGKIATLFSKVKQSRVSSKRFAKNGKSYKMGTKESQGLPLIFKLRSLKISHFHHLLLKFLNHHGCSKGQSDPIGYVMDAASFLSMIVISFWNGYNFLRSIFLNGIQFMNAHRDDVAKLHLYCQAMCDFRIRIRQHLIDLRGCYGMSLSDTFTTCLFKMTLLNCTLKRFILNI